MTTKAKNSLYIHIPFCSKKCNYCSFISFENAQDIIEQYFLALQSELTQKTAGKALHTVYIGGGTPSLAPIELYKKLELNFAKDYEFTLEVNPKTVDKKYLVELKKLGVNRLSIGVQSFDDKILKSIGRSHSSQNAIECVKLATEAGFENISIDLIYGLPNQNFTTWESTLKQATSLDIKHISAYGLKIESGTPFGRQTPNNLPSDDDCADMYLQCIKILKNSGFQQYEISNFSKPNYESKHNLTYWQNNPYIACGVSAHGYENKVRYENSSELESYLKDPLFCKKTKLTDTDILEEAIFLGLRTTSGISLQEFKHRYKINFSERYKDILEKYEDFFITTKDSIKLNTQGLMLSNTILSEFIS